MKSYHTQSYIEERKIEPINILIIFLLGLAAGLFILGAIDSFKMTNLNQQTLIIVVGIVYFISLIAFLYPKKRRTNLHTPEPEVIEKERIVEKPIFRDVIHYRDRNIIKEVEKPVIKEKIVEKEKPIIKKSKYLGSKYNQRYHLRTCRFSGAIKPEYLIEEEDKNYFKLRGYKPCKVCHPEKS